MTNAEIARILQNMIDEAEENITRLAEAMKGYEMLEHLDERRADLKEAMELIAALAAPDAKEGQGEQEDGDCASCAYCLKFPAGDAVCGYDGPGCDYLADTPESSQPAAPAPEVNGTNIRNEAEEEWNAKHGISTPAPEPEGEELTAGQEIAAGYLNRRIIGTELGRLAVEIDAAIETAIRARLSSPSPKEVPMAMLMEITAECFAGGLKDSEVAATATAIAARYGYKVKE